MPLTTPCPVSATDLASPDKISTKSFELFTIMTERVKAGIKHVYTALLNIYLGWKKKGNYSAFKIKDKALAQLLVVFFLDESSSCNVK